MQARMSHSMYHTANISRRLCGFAKSFPATTFPWDRLTAAFPAASGTSGSRDHSPTVLPCLLRLKHENFALPRGSASSLQTERRRERGAIERYLQIELKFLPPAGILLEIKEDRGRHQTSLQLIIKVAQSLRDRNMELVSEASWCPLKFVTKKLQSESVRLQAHTAWLFPKCFQIS